MSGGLHAHLALDPPGQCPVAALSRRTRVTHFVPGDPGAEPAQVVFLTPDDGSDVPTPFDVVVAASVLTVARLPSDEPTPGDGPVCDRAPGCCLGWWLRFLPISPYALVWSDGRLHLYFAVDSSEALTEVVGEARRRGFGVHLRQVSGSETETPSPAHVVWLDDLTERQLEVMSVAVEMGYFDADGASAEEVAARLDIAKSTLSGHLRAASEKILSRLF